jgi:acyl-coenzyme A thioesterase PaaI-like protein
MSANQSRFPGASLTGRDWHHPNCYGCGEENDKGLHADFTFDENTGEVRFTYTAAEHFEGAPGFAHGGMLATLLDEAQGCLCFHVGHVVMTEKLHLNYHRATPLGIPLHVRAWLTAVRKRRLYTRAIIFNDAGEIHVSSSASWYVLPERLTRRMFQGKYSEEFSEKSLQLIEANRRRAREIRRRLKLEKENPTFPSR